METALFNDGYIRFSKDSNGGLRAFPKVLEWNGGRYLVLDMRTKTPYLPTEFYAHEFLGVNARNEDSLLRFAARWGVPDNPCRWRRYENEFIPPIGVTANPFAMVHPDNRYPSKSDIAEMSEEWQSVLLNYSAGHIVSIAEAASVVDASQRVIKSLLGWVKSVLLDGQPKRYIWEEDWVIREAWDFVTYAATPGIYPIDIYHGLNGSIISAVFDQLQATFLSPEPWKICANDACGMPFKRKQNSPGAESKSGRYNPRALYCCEKCRNDSGNRRKRERIDHGI